MLKLFSKYWWLWRILTGFLISIFLLKLFYSDIDFSLLRNYSLRKNIASLTLAAVLGIVGFMFQAIKWSYFFQLNMPFKKRFYTFFSSVIIGHVLNTFLPFKAGEIAKPLHLSKTLSLNKIYVFSTCIADRFFDIFILFVIAAAFGLSNKLLLRIQQFLSFLTSFKLAVSIIILLVVILLLILFYKRKLYTLKVNATAQFLQLLKNLKKLPITSIGLIFLFTTFFWNSTIFANYFILQSTNLPVALSTYTVAVYMTFFSVFAYIVPSAPASLGTLNTAIILSLQYRANEISLNINNAVYQQILLCSILQYIISIVPDIAAAIWLLATSKDIKSYRNDTE